MRLAELQRDFQAWLVEPTDAAAQQLAGEEQAGLWVYQNNYRAQLVACLESSFPQVRKWLGDQAFLHAAAMHIGDRPPHAWTLDVYGQDFGETLTAVFPDNPDLHELAWIELALADAFVAANATPVAPEMLAAIDWSNAHIRLTPSLKTRIATTNAETVWSALCAERTLPDSEMLAEPRGLLVWRREFTSWLNEVDALEYEALLHVQRNGSFAALCDMLVERLGEAEGVEKSGLLLAGWLGGGLIVGIEENSRRDAPQPE
jgi:hypothetical protein